MKKKQDIQLDPAIADQMLSNIFDICEYEGNTVPLQVLSSYSNFRKEKNYLQRGIVLVFLILLLLAPVLFVTPTITVEKTGEFQQRPAVWVSYQNLLPIHEIYAGMDDHPVPVQETKRGSFLIFPDRNGELQVKITLVNGQSGTETITVENADLMPPKLVKSQRADHELTIFLSDDSGELDFEACYAKTEQGKIIRPLRYSEEDMCLTFAETEQTLNIYVQDQGGNVLQLIYVN